VTTPAQRSALAALQAAGPAIARLETEQNSEDRAADLIEGWSAVETALRSLMGGSNLSGRALIHELRSRRALTLEQANALAEFEAARTRAERPTYVPTETDVAAARDAFTRLDAGLRAAESAPVDDGAGAARMAVPLPAGPGAQPEVAPRTFDDLAPTPRAATADWQKWLIGAVAVVVLVTLGAWLYVRSRQDTLEHAVQLYRQGQREQAVAEFGRAAREDPKSALPHVYLSRMAREVGNLTEARDEANKAIQADPANALALREMGAYLLTAGNYELARRFYVRAVTADPSDKTAQGYLGCSLIRLGRVDEGRRWLTRAGPGTWSSCGTMAPAAAVPGAGALPPGGQPSPAPQRIP
jgi:tetratricopeptide (TPR) repeat protein